MLFLGGTRRFQNGPFGTGARWSRFANRPTRTVAQSGESWMPDFCSMLLGILAVLTIVAVLGHGLWLMAAAFFRAIGAENPPPPPSRQTCPNCGNKAFSLHGQCRECGWAAAPRGPDMHATDAWKVAERQLDNLRRRGLLSDDRYQEMSEILLDERGRARRGPAAGRR